MTATNALHMTPLEATAEALALQLQTAFVAPTLADKQITISPQWSVYDDDGNLDATLLEDAIRKQFPHVASVTVEPGGEASWAADFIVKIIEQLSFDSPLLHFMVWEEPETDTVGLSRIDPGGRVLT